VRKYTTAFFLGLNTREERSKHYLMLPEEMDQPEPTSAEDVLFGLPPGTNAMNSQQMLVFADNKAMADEREEEMRKIVSSIVDLNSIFKDLAHMVVEQVNPESFTEYKSN
jgi:syntaxin 16